MIKAVFTAHNDCRHVGGRAERPGQALSPNENAPDAGLSHGALVEQPLSAEAVSWAQLIPRSRSQNTLRPVEPIGTPCSSKYVHSCHVQRLIVPFEESVRRTQHAVALGFVLFSQSVPHLE